jgi:CMP/dCMP kinase
MVGDSGRKDNVARLNFAQLQMKSKGGSRENLREFASPDNDIKGLNRGSMPSCRCRPPPGASEAQNHFTRCSFRNTPAESIWHQARMRHGVSAMIFTVAIDGPAAAGKGTISSAVAEQFGFRHLDTGLLYRAVGVKGGDPVAAARALTPKDLGRTDLRTLDAGQAASRVAVIPEVRAALVDFQRRFARSEGGAVLDGRDIGTVICPEAEVKLYVTASAEVRAHRRWLEVGGEEARVLAEVRERDARDMGRVDAPLKAAADAVVIDTSTMGIAEAVEAACGLVAGRLAQRG